MNLPTETVACVCSGPTITGGSIWVVPLVVVDTVGFGVVTAWVPEEPQAAAPTESAIKAPPTVTAGPVIRRIRFILTRRTSLPVCSRSRGGLVIKATVAKPVNSDSRGDINSQIMGGTSDRRM